MSIDGGWGLGDALLELLFKAVISVYEWICRFQWELPFTECFDFMDRRGYFRHDKECERILKKYNLVLFTNSAIEYPKRNSIVIN